VWASEGWLGPLDFEFFSKTGLFFSFEREKKQISPLLAPLEKFWKNILVAPLGKFFRQPWVKVYMQSIKW